MTPAEALGLIFSIVGALAKIEQAREEGKKVDDARVKVILEQAVSALEAEVAGLAAAIQANNETIDKERQPIAAASIVEAAAIAAETLK